MLSTPQLQNDTPNIIIPATPTLTWGYLSCIASSETALIELNQECVWMGRHATCDVHLNGLEISNRHCCFTFQEGVAFLLDQSTNGVFVNGQRIRRHQKVVLQHRDEITLAVKSPQFAFRDNCFVYLDPAGMKQDSEREPEWKTIDQHYLVSKKVLGSGSFATVHLAYHRNSCQAVAAKIIDKRPLLLKPKQLSNMAQEIRILKSIHHPNIVGICDVLETATHVYLFLELVDGGELFHYILKCQRIPEKECKLYFYQLLQGLNYLHEQSIVHRDLKPENILLQPGQVPRVMISDFGLARMVPQQRMNTFCGTLSYLAPEMLSKHIKSRGYDKAVDCWSLGVVLYAMLSGTLPFSEEEESQLSAHIQSGDLQFPLEHWKLVSEPAKDLVKALLRVDPEKRFTVQQALQHDWIQQDKGVMACYAFVFGEKNGKSIGERLGALLADESGKHDLLKQDDDVESNTKKQRV